MIENIFIHNQTIFEVSVFRITMQDKTLFVKKGDSESVSIASASILAKTLRDNLMSKYAKSYPHYNWVKNKGYGTKEHFKAIKKFGLTSLHRKSFLSKIVTQ